MQHVALKTETTSLNVEGTLLILQDTFRMWLQVEGQEEQLVAVVLLCSCVGLHNYTTPYAPAQGLLYRPTRHWVTDCGNKPAQTSTVA